MEAIEVSTKGITRVALAMYVGKVCTECGHKFCSVNDILERNPICSKKDENGLGFACKKCWDRKQEDGQ